MGGRDGQRKRSVESGYVALVASLAVGTRSPIENVENSFHVFKTLGTDFRFCQRNVKNESPSRLLGNINEKKFLI